jgi:gamma-glutamylputrescine oxidase
MRCDAMADAPSAVNATGSDYPPSYYAATANQVTASRRLNDKLRTDVCVIGGGYTGLSAALHLRERGFTVALLEARRIGWGASGRNGGQIGTGQRQDEAELEKRCGADTARLLFDSAEAAKATVRRLIDDYAIDCDLAPGQMVTAARPAHAGELERRAARLAARYGYTQMRYLSREQLREQLASDVYHGATLDDGALHLHPLNYALGLARACRQAGVHLFEYSPVRSYSRRTPSLVETPRAHVRTDHVVVACNGYLGRLEPRLAGRIMPINNFIVATAPLDDPAALIRDRVCVHDTRFVVNYFRMSADGRLLFGGGENYSARFPRDIAGFVRPYVTRVFPQLAELPIDYAWGGTLAITLGRLPHLGRLPPNLYFAHGFSGHGVAMGSFAGKLIADALAGEPSGFDLYAKLPTRRFPGGTLLRWPGLVAGMLWYAMRDRL